MCREESAEKQSQTSCSKLKDKYDISKELHILGIELFDLQFKLGSSYRSECFDHVKYLLVISKQWEDKVDREKANTSIKLALKYEEQLQMIWKNTEATPNDRQTSILQLFHLYMRSIELEKGSGSQVRVFIVCSLRTYSSAVANQKEFFD